MGLKPPYGTQQQEKTHGICEPCYKLHFEPELGPLEDKPYVRTCDP